MPAPSIEAQLGAFIAAVQVAASNSARGLFAAERSDDPTIGAVVIECDGEGVNVTLLGPGGQPVGGYSL